MIMSTTFHYGVRVHAEDFADTFRKAFPLKKVPPHLVTKFLAKVSPVPVGATHDNLREWSETQKVKGKPIRALNATTWLLSTWGLDAVMLVPISWQERTRPTVLGKKSRPFNGLDDDDMTEDWMQTNDPWAGWKSSASSSGGSSSSTREPKASHVSTQVQMQVSAQKKELETIQARIQTLEENADQSEKNNQAWKTNITKDLRSFKEEIRHGVQGF